MVVVLALAFLLSATVTIYMLFRIGDTRVPPVVGKGVTEAQKLTEKAGLKVKIQRRGDPKIPEDMVIESRPAPNSSVKKDSNVTLIVSSGATQTKSELLPFHDIQEDGNTAPGLSERFASHQNGGFGVDAAVAGYRRFAL